MNTAPLVTVIVPVYNVAGYLPQCLKSIVEQTYTRLEILVVDDGSTDKSGSIADEWALMDERIKVIHKPNGGLSDARNAALDVAQGDYITCIDSDDYVHTSYVERLYKALTATQADIAVCQWADFAQGNAPKTAPLPEPPVYKQYSQDEAIKAVFYQQGLTHSAWGRLYKRSLFEGTRYPKGMLYEDLAIAFDLLLKTGKVVRTSDTLYYYRRRSDSITGTFSPKRGQVLDILEGLEKRVSLEAPRYLPAVRSRLLSASFNMLRLMPPCDPRYLDLSYRSWNNIVRLRDSCLRDVHVRARNKAAILISYMGQAALIRAINGK